jgi:hypothetical protein
MMILLLDAAPPLGHVDDFASSPCRNRLQYRDAWWCGHPYRPSLLRATFTNRIYNTGFDHVKLIQEEEHHLPDAPKALQPWYVRLMKRGMVLLFSPGGMTVSVGILMTLLLTGIVSTNYLDVSRNVDHRGASLKDFYAAFRIDVPDIEATQRKIDRARQSITPIYQEAEPHNQDILQSLNDFLDDVTASNTDSTLSLQERYRRFTDLADTTPNAEKVYQRYLAKPISVKDWEAISNAARNAMHTILKNGFTEADDQLERDTTIRRSIPRTGFNTRYRELVYFLVDASLEPNLILDEKAMEKSRQQLTSRISKEQPEVKIYAPGQKIVGVGEKISAVQLAALEKMGKSAQSNNWPACLGVFLLSMLFTFTLWSALYNFHEKRFFQPAYASLLASLTLVTVMALQLQKHGTFSGSIPLHAFPLAAYALTLAIFLHPRISVLATTLLVFLVGLSMHADFYGLSVLLFGSFMGVYVLSKRINYSERGQLMYAGLYVGATNILILMAISLLRPNINEHNFLSSLLDFLGWGFLSGVFSGILTIGTMPLLEKMFSLVTPFTLMELGNHDQPLLKRMQFEAPGTFHHSLMVATLAEAAAEAIGANALLTRVGCLYHDIGKMKRPLFFIENQAYFGVENPHDKLTPRLSKMVITAHPRDSIEMAKQHRLPEILMRFMTEHHGTLTAGYFYNKACIEEGAENVNKSQFRYPGPKPGIKETAIVMLADACESAVRALKNPTVAQVEERIDKLVQQRIEEGQFDNCPITFQDINRIKQTFVRILRGIQHNRIEYQQNMMKELGRKLPAGTLVDHAGMQETLRQVQQVKPDGGDGKSQHG